MIIPKLLPCPFCGGKAEFSYQPWHQSYNSCVFCKDCLASSGQECADEENKDEIMKKVCKKWNRRASAVADIQKSKNEQASKTPVHKSKNEHKNVAGRKTILNPLLYDRIMMHHKKGSSIRLIKHYIEAFEGETISVGFIHKVINMPAPAELLEDQLTVAGMEQPA